MNQIAHDKFRELLEKFDTAILTTLDAGGKMHARPMAIAEIENTGDLIFLTDQASGKISEITNDAKVSVTCQNGWKDTVVLRGTASVFRDTQKAKQIWKKSFQTWFPGGPGDPNIAMIRVKGEEGEYWDNSGLQGLKYMVKAVKAVATKTRPEPDSVEEHAKVKLG